MNLSVSQADAKLAKLSMSLDTDKTNTTTNKLNALG
jgi:hypothetical protein